MRASELWAVAGVCVGGFTAAAQDRPPLQRLGNAIYVEPIRVAQCRFERGDLVRTTGWSARGGSAGRCPSTDRRVFDCFGDEDSDGVPDDFGGCGMGEERWFFGTGYCNGFVTNDMTRVRGTPAIGYGRADFGWYWTCGGFGTEQCVIAIFTQESDPDACEADSFDYSGWLLDFGNLPCNPGGYYYTNADVSSVGVWPGVTSGDGSYGVFFLTSSGSAVATCAQPMLWGVSDGGGAPRGPGSQKTNQLDDIDEPDGSHDVPSECYTYSFGVCPDPLGAMMQFWGCSDESSPCSFADCNADFDVDIQDFVCFLGLWATGDLGADCDGTGEIDTRDFMCFLGVWSDCR